MTKGQKTSLIVVLGLVLLLGISWFILKSAVEKILNSQETRTEIGRLVEQNIAGFIPRPKVMISSLRLAVLSGIDIGRTDVSSQGATILNAIGEARCGMIKLLISGNCLGELALDLGEVGRVNLQTVITRKLIVNGLDKTPLRASGSVTDLAVARLIPESRGGARQMLQINPGTLSGDLTATVTMSRDIAVKGSLKGTLKGAEFTAAIAGRTQKTVQDIPVQLGFDASRLFFEKPLQVTLFGLAVQYSGDLRFGREPEWNGKVSARGQPLALNYVPAVFRCKNPPQSPAAFKIKGPFSGPDCG
jgi:hypothetical protein